MSTVTYAPTQKVNIGIGKDTLNDFARKYNLEIEAVYDILNRHNARAVVFYDTSDYWTQTTDGYKLSLPHNGNVVFAVYRTDSANQSAQVLTGVKQGATNVEIESVEKFSGFMLYGAMNPEKGIGYNTEDDIVEKISDIKSEAEDARDVVLNEIATLKEQLHAVLEEHSDGVMQFDENFDLMPCRFPIGNDLWDVNVDNSITPVYKESEEPEEPDEPEEPEDDDDDSEDDSE